MTYWGYMNRSKNLGIDEYKGRMNEGGTIGRSVRTAGQLHILTYICMVKDE